MFLQKNRSKNYFTTKINFSSYPSLEAQIASISDDIAYNSHDLEDGLKSNLFKLKDLEKIPILKNIIFRHTKRKNNYSMDLIIRQIIREIINEMVRDVIKTTKYNIKKYMNLVFTLSFDAFLLIFSKNSIKSLFSI